jgi:hypothetical protein
MEVLHHLSRASACEVDGGRVVNVYAIIIVLCISIDKSIIRTRSLRNTHSQETQCYPRYLGITRRSCLEAHMVLDMEYREQEST